MTKVKNCKKKNNKIRKREKKNHKNVKLTQKQSIVLGVRAIKGLIVSKKGRK